MELEANEVIPHDGYVTPACGGQGLTPQNDIVTQSLDVGSGWPPAQALPQLPARRVLQLGERGFCPGGRASGSERGGQLGLVPLPITLLDKVLYSALLSEKRSI
jgi:hypothetical protein